MTDTARNFTPDQLAAIGIPDIWTATDKANRAEHLHEEQVDSRRWVSVHQLVFRAPDDGKAYSVTYEQGLTEDQDDTDPWNDADVVKAFEVEERAEIVTRWKRVTDRPGMAPLHLVINHPAPGEWYGRLDVAEALEAAGWTADDAQPLNVFRHPSGAVWAVTNESDDSGLDCPNGTTVEFPGSTPTVVIVAACLAATHPATA